MRDDPIPYAPPATPAAQEREEQTASEKRAKGRRALVRPDRLRMLERPFGWLPCRLLTNGTLGRMRPMERQLYLLLVLAADSRGLSFYGDQRTRRTLGCTQSELHQARWGLIDQDLLAFDGTTYQLLPLPRDVKRPADNPQPEHTRQPQKRVDKTLRDRTATTTVTDTEARWSMPTTAHLALRGILGDDFDNQTEPHPTHK